MTTDAVIHGFYLGQKVQTVKTGFRRTGHIVGVQYGWLYKYIKSQITADTSWDVLFPGWADGLVYSVWFEDKLKSCTYDEWKRGALETNPEMTEEEIAKSYEDLPTYNPVAFCQEDLEVVDNEVYVPVVKGKQ